MTLNYCKVLDNIKYNLKLYLQLNKNVKNLVIGMSGGLDSTVCAYIARQVCDELNLGHKLYGTWIGIESNSPEEHDRAVKIGERWCHQFKDDCIMGDAIYNYNKVLIESFFHEDNEPESEKEVKIRRGNIKARVRMTILYNIAQVKHGMVIDTDNITERLLGFWTLHGDVGDYTLLSGLWKTEVFELGKYIASTLEGIDKTNFMDVVNAVPTDGLGITSSDVEQFGCDTYDEVDHILTSHVCLDNCDSNNELRDISSLYAIYGKEKVDNVFDRFIKSSFKRNNPCRISRDETTKGAIQTLEYKGIIND